MYKFNKNDLDLVAANTGFLRDNLEKVLRLSDILQHININSLLYNHLALKGGTAINLVVFNLPRLSVDIDLDFTKHCLREEMFVLRSQINNDILKYMTSQGYQLNPSSKNPHSLDSWVFYYLNSSQIKRKLIPVLKKSDKFEFEAAKSEVKTYLTTLNVV
jgi:predicted nucleotidyltransferase component of viral defense system